MILWEAQREIPAHVRELWPIFFTVTDAEARVLRFFASALRSARVTLLSWRRA